MDFKKNGFLEQYFILDNIRTGREKIYLINHVLLSHRGQWSSSEIGIIRFLIKFDLLWKKIFERISDFFLPKVSSLEKRKVPIPLFMLQL